MDPSGVDTSDIRFTGWSSFRSVNALANADIFDPFGPVGPRV